MQGIILLCVLTQNAFASGAASRQADGGVWTGGGGEVVSYQFNPWFVGAHSTVTFCISTDPQSFSLATSDTLKRSVNNALMFWTNEFRAHPSGSVDFGFDKINFLNIHDCEQADLSFMFGSLTSEQEDVLKTAKVDSGSYVGLAFQTTYDETHLRGRGFIYLAPDDGSLPAIPRGAWSVPNTVYDVLLHELGHVFGIQHQTAGFMSYEFPNLRVKQAVDPSSMRFFAITHSGFPCDDILPETRELLKEIFQQSETCASGTLYGLSVSATVGVIGLFPKDFKGIPAGMILGNIRPNQVPDEEVYDYPIRLHLTDKQEVFTSKEKELLYPRYRQIYSAQLEIGEAILPISVMSEPMSSSLRLSTFFKGKVLSDIFHGH